MNSEVSEILPEELAAMDRASFDLLDVRELVELEGGYIEGAVHISRGLLELEIEERLPIRERLVVIYCASGIRSLLATQTLLQMGYSKVLSLKGGIAGWQEAGFPVAGFGSLSDEQRKRYARQISVPEVGVKGQERLCAARVLIVGAGGLGCPVAYYLSAAGVGTLGVVDFDVVEESNLQRQILHSTATVGMPKVRSAESTLTAFNPQTKVEAINARLSLDNVESIVSGYDIVVDGSDNFQTKYLLNDACGLLAKPLVYGSVFKFEGQITVFHVGDDEAQCYRCLFPNPPAAGVVPSCAEAGVLGVLPGVIGLLQSVEAIKLITGLGTSLAGRLLVYDALKATFSEYSFKQNPNCRCSRAEWSLSPATLGAARSCRQ